MHALIAVAVPVLALVGLAAPAAAEPHPPPFVDHTEWVYWDGLSSLRVYPTSSGRAAAGADEAGDAGDEAWAEVLSHAPDAATAGMREQFLCHWRWAEFAQPGKTSWNLEPWRPVVSDAAMIAARCNPGTAEEPF